MNPQMKYKMIVLDLDGTLTNDNKEITPRTFDSLMEAQRRGVRIVLASGRPTHVIVPLVRELSSTRCLSRRCFRCSTRKPSRPGWKS